MIANINNNTNFNGTARFAQYGKETLVKKTSKNTDRIIKAMSDDMGKRGELLAPVSKEKGITFERFIEMIMGKRLNFGKESKFISNMQTVAQGTKGEVSNYISYGTIITDKPGGFHFTLDLKG